MEKILNSISQGELQHSISGLRLLGSSTLQPLSLGSSQLFMNTTLAARNQAAQISSDKAITSQFQKTHTLTYIQLLDALCSSIYQESYTVQLGYITFSTRCNFFLISIYKESREEIIELDDELFWQRAMMHIVPY